MQFCKVISYKLKVFKIVYYILPFLFCRDIITVLLELHTLIKMPKSGVCLKHISPVSNNNGKQK